MPAESAEDEAARPASRGTRLKTKVTPMSPPPTPIPPIQPVPAEGSASGPDAGARGLALVVDDDRVNRCLLTLLLKREGFATREACSGQEALAAFAEERPDIVLMDVMMPHMDGFETTARLKALAGTDFLPVIFLTALQDEDSLARCIQAGGDDFLTKPIDLMVLKSRILAMERVRDLQRGITADNRLLADILERERQEQELAERVFNRAIKNRNAAIAGMSLLQRPAVMFSGDLLLVQRLPDNGLRVLAGDFTGHGLAVAIGALPIVDAFHAMTIKGIRDEELLGELNRKLHQLLPADRFMAALLITIPGDGRELFWWNAGMPSAWLRSRRGLVELAPHALPLGVLPKLPDEDPPHRIQIESDDGLLLFSDGLLTARNRMGELFQGERLGAVLAGWVHGGALYPDLIAALERHIGDSDQIDDIAVLEIPLGPDLFEVPPPVSRPVPAGAWSWSLELPDEQLGSVRSVEAMLQPLGLLDGLETHLPALEAIVTELSAHVIERHLLGSACGMRAQAGHCRDPAYLARHRADGYCGGPLILEIQYEPLSQGGRIRVRLMRRSALYEPQASQASDEPDRECRAGEPLLLQGLCESLTYCRSEPRIEAVYRW